MSAPSGFRVPPPQQPWQAAVEKARAALAAQAPEQIAWLGGEADGAAIRLRVLGETLSVDPAGGAIRTSAGAEVRPAWGVLVLHYLSVRGHPDPGSPSVTFADLLSGRTYAGVYQNRVIERLCATVGRAADALRAAAAALGATAAEGGDAAFDLPVFPRLAIRLIWHAGDEEFPPRAVFLLPDNIEALFCTEDIVVLCECCVARLQGKPF